MKNWEETIFKDRPRLSPDSKFRFSCYKGLPCFGKCCGNVNIFLTPYDVLRLKKALGIHSEEFLEKYTLRLILRDQQIPVALLKMGDDEDKRCPFVTSEGCLVYQDRPWACRMYPLGLAFSNAQPANEEFCFIVDDESLCLGFAENNEWTVRQWLVDQGVDIYNRNSEAYMQLTLHRSLQEGKDLGPAKIEMFYQTCYNLDGFRRNLFNSSFLDRFDVDDETIKKVKTDDVELLNFGISWLRFALFAEDTLKVKEEVWEKRRGELGL